MTTRERRKAVLMLSAVSLMALALAPSQFAESVAAPVGELQARAAKRRNTEAQGVSPGGDIEINLALKGRHNPMQYPSLEEVFRPFRAQHFPLHLPRAHALGFGISPLRGSRSDSLTGSAQAPASVEPPRIPFPPNEKLVFEVRFSRFPLNVSLGQVTFEYLGVSANPAIPGANFALTPREGETFAGFRAHVQSQGLILSLFGVSYKGRLETLINRSTFGARLSLYEMHDGKKNTSQTSVFDAANGRIRYATRNLATSNEPAKIVDLPFLDRSQSLLSAFYYVRLMPLQEDQVNCFLVSHDELTFDLEVFFRGREEIEVSRQKMRAIRVEPKIFGPGRYFPKRQGDLQIWMTDDERRLPLKLVAKTTQGTLSANLVNYLEQPPFRQMGPTVPVK